MIDRERYHPNIYESGPSKDPYSEYDPRTYQKVILAAREKRERSEQQKIDDMYKKEFMPPTPFQPTEGIYTNIQGSGVPQRERVSFQIPMLIGEYTEVAIAGTNIPDGQKIFVTTDTPEFSQETPYMHIKGTNTPQREAFTVGSVLPAVEPSGAMIIVALEKPGAVTVFESDSGDGGVTAK